MSKQQLSQAEVDALLNALRQSPGAESPDPEANAGSGAGVWETVGEPLAAVLTKWLNGAWRREIPVISVVRGEAAPSAQALGPATAVVRLGPPLSQRMWFFWGEARGSASKALDTFLADVGAMLPWGWSFQALDPQTAMSADGLLLPFRGVTPTDNVALTLGVERRPLPRLVEHFTSAEREAAADAAPGSGAPSRSVDIDDLEVEASVYVGGGLYPLSTLSGLRPGAILPLTTEVGEPVVIALGSRVIARGEIMVGADGNLAVRLTEVLLGDEGRAATPPWLARPAAGSGTARLRPPAT